MDTADHSCTRSDESEEDGTSDCPPPLVWAPESHEKCDGEERMSRREGIIDRMRNERCDASDDRLWTRSPLWNTEIHEKMEDKGKDNHEENLERPDLVSVVPELHASEPEKEKEEGSPEHHRFTEELDSTSEFYSDERSCPCEGIDIELEEVV